MKVIFGDLVKRLLNMLPNKMKISEQATNSLRRLQSNTSLTVNIGARLAFFYSIERGYRFNPIKKTNSKPGRELDKNTWLGDSAGIVEMLLKETYPNFTESQLTNAWAAHVLDGGLQIENQRTLISIAENIPSQSSS